MNNSKFCFPLLSVMCMTLPGCFEPQVPVADGRTVLTTAQYEALREKMKQAIATEAVKNPEEKSTVQEDYLALGTRYYQNRDFASAATQLEQAVNGDSNNSRAWYLLGSCYEHIGDARRAQAAFKKSYDIQVAQGYIPDVSKVR